MNWHKSGFTFIEIIMVLAVMGVIATISLPRFDRVIEDYKLKTDARQLAWVLRSSRQEAIISGHQYTIIFKPTSNCYTKIGNKHTTYMFSRGIEVPFGEYSFRVNETGYPICGFTSSGAVTPQAGYINIKNKYGKRISIIVNPCAGRVRIQE